ncbi:sphingolipid transporter [Aureococcus anophagefferens]|nr:sphingolipid transporter [Aureococcus anophagefferens]
MALPSMLRLALVAIAAARQVSVSRHMALTIGDATHNVFDFGAAGDGETDDTAALQAAINACAKTGGLAVVPAGHTFVITSVTLNVSHTGLQIDGALKVADRDYYTAKAEGKDVIVITKGITDVAITGTDGLIDGGGAAWWPHKGDFRPHMVGSDRATRLLVHGVTFLNPPSHCLELSAAFVELSHVNIFAPPTRPSLCDAWVTNVTVRNVVFHGTTAGCRIKTRPKCAGRVWDVLYENLTMTDVEMVFDISMFYDNDHPYPKDKKTTLKIEDVTFRDVTSANHKFSGSFYCDEDSPCERLTFDRVHLVTDDAWTCKQSRSGDACCSHSKGTATDVQPAGLTDCFAHSL